MVGLAGGFEAGSIQSMKVIIFGATGMVGQGVLRECLLSNDVTSVLTAGRSATGQQHPKLREITLTDLSNLEAVEKEGTDYDACFFCLGVSSAGMNEQDYTRVTYDLTLSVARMLIRVNPGMTFIYVSGTGTDSSEKGRSMWARVKGRTENDLLKLGFKGAYMFRPGYIQPLDGIKTKTPLYRVFYAILAPLYPVLKWLAPSYVTTTRNLGRAMIRVGLHGAEKIHLENRDINSLGD
jgi:uncharacterized protein YbjT (DUF2867 family)